ncbi:uncharacterized protein METZ01_LOCUS328099, partial [marine metagenome]
MSVGWLALILLAACGGNQSTKVDAPGTSAVTDSMIVTSYEIDDSRSFRTEHPNTFVDLICKGQNDLRTEKRKGPPKNGGPSHMVDEARMEPTGKPLGIAFFGAGDVSGLHADGVHKCPDAHLVGLWNRTPELGREKAATFGCRTYETPELLLADPAVDAVSILTNLETHLEFASMALKAGKHVLVEKPVGVSVGEIESMRDLAKRSGLVCMPGHNFIHEDSIIRSKELIDGGDL